MSESAPTYIWRKSATPEWLRANEARLTSATSGEFAVIERPGRKRLLLEAPCRERTLALRLTRALGGKSEKLPRGWLDRFLRGPVVRPIRIGPRLFVSTEADDAGTLVIPAGAAFGTGDHATTAMSLRLLERVTRHWPGGWRMLDAGTGSGVLALAGRRFGAGEVIGIDNDPLAISTAKQNARANAIHGVKFIAGDVNRMQSGTFDLIAANLFSELLIALLPRFRRSLSAEGWLILSGILREQEAGVKRALRADRFRIVERRRRGKWIALAANSGS